MKASIFISKGSCPIDTSCPHTYIVAPIYSTRGIKHYLMICEEDMYLILVGWLGQWVSSPTSNLLRESMLTHKGWPKD